MIFQKSDTGYIEHHEVTWLAVVALMIEIFTTPFFIWSLCLLWLAQIGVGKFVEAFFSVVKNLILG